MGALPVRLKLKRMAVRLHRTATRLLWGHGTVYVGERVGEYRERWEKAARHLGAELVPLSDEVWEIRQGGRSARVSNHIVQIDDLVTMLLAGDKAYCHRLAQELEIPVPHHKAFTMADLDDAWKFAAAVGGPVVVKPARGSASGIGVTTHVTTRSRLEWAACLASLFDETFLVEQMVFGESCRLLFLDGRFVHAVRRRGVRLTGDGRSTIRQLLADSGQADLTADPTTLHTLTSQALAPDSVPQAGIEILARSLPAEATLERELRTVYDEPITGLVSKELATEALRMVEGIGSRFAGVDLITKDPGRSLSDGGGALIEINTTPGIHHHDIDPDADPERTVAVRVLRRLLETGSPQPATQDGQQEVAR